jgi:antitoxin VapB
VALNIKSAHAEKVVRELARLTGESVTEAVTKAAEARLEAVKAEREAAKQRKMEASMAILRPLWASLSEEDRKPIPKEVFDEMWGEFDDEPGNDRHR